MNIFLTGSNGFVGTLLCKMLKEKYSDLNLVEFNGDLKNKDQLIDQLNSHEWNKIIHLGGLSKHSECESHPEEAQLINVESTRIIVDHLKNKNKNKKAHFIFPSTCLIYEMSDDDLIETSQINPTSVYSKSKFEAENIILNLLKGTDVRYSIIRLFNYTHKTQLGTVLADTYVEIKNCIDSLVILKKGDISIVRDFGAIQDLLGIFEKLILCQDSDSEIYNICSGYGKKLSEIIPLIANKLNKKYEIIFDSSKIRLGDPKRIVGNSDKIQKRYNWKPQYSLSESVFVEAFLSEL